MNPRSAIFVGGAARTGTTLLQSILCSVPGTSKFFPECTSVRNLVDSFEKTCVQEERFSGHTFGGAEPLRKTYRDMFQVLFSGMDREHSDSVLVLKQPALTPAFNILSSVLESDASFVCLVRDPRDCIASMIKWGERATEEGRYHWFADRDIFRLSRYFLSFYGFLNNWPKKHELPFMIRYENLVTNPFEALKGFSSQGRVDLSFLSSNPDTEWGNVDLTKSGPVGLASSQLYGKDVSAKRIGVGVDALTETELADIEKLCSEFMRRFEYVPIASKQSLRKPLVLKEFGDHSTPVQPISSPAGDNERLLLQKKISLQKGNIENFTQTIKTMKLRAEEVGALHKVQIENKNQVIESLKQRCITLKENHSANQNKLLARLDERGKLLNSLENQLKQTNKQNGENNDI